MFSSSTKELAGRRSREDLFISVFLCLYILSFYVFISRVTNLISSAVYYLFLALTFIKMVARQTPFKLTGYSLWYLGFAILAGSSYFYAVNTTYLLNSLYGIFVCWIVVFAFTQYVKDLWGFRRIFSYFAIAPLLLIFYLLATNQFGLSSQRLGQSLFGNANNLAMVMMLSLFCLSWFLIYEKRKYTFLIILYAAVCFYITALTGGRKFFLLPFVMLALLLILKNWRKDKLSPVWTILLILVIAIAAAWIVMNIPTLYNSIGIRFEGLANFLGGKIASSDASTLDRYKSIVDGWNWFSIRPILGYGLNGYQTLRGAKLDMTYAHNNYIELLVDLGIVGTLFYYAYYIFLLIKLIRIKEDLTGLRDFFLVGILVFMIFEIGAVTYNLVSAQIFIGLASAFVWIYEKERRQVLNEQDPASAGL